MSKIVEEFQANELSRLFTNDPFVIDRYRQVQTTNSELTSVIEGSGAPTFAAPKHSQYFDTAASKYYRNTDGGTTWVALN